MSLSVPPSVWNYSASTGRIFIKFGIFRKSAEEFQVLFQSDKNNLCFTWRPLCIYDYLLLNSYSENCSRESCKENQNTKFVLNNFFPENRAVCKIMCENTVEGGRPGLTEYGVSASRAGQLQATDTHSEYVIQ